MRTVWECWEQEDQSAGRRTDWRLIESSGDRKKGPRVVEMNNLRNGDLTHVIYRHDSGLMIVETWRRIDPTPEVTK